MSKRKCCPPPCPPKVCAFVRSCAGVAVNGATVTATGPGGFNQSGTTDATGWWCADAGAAGSYPVTASDGTNTATQTVAVGTACTSYTASFCLGGSGGAHGLNVCVSVGGCAGLGGAAVTLKLDGVTIDSWTSVAGTPHCVCLPNVGVVAITATKARFNSNTTTFTPTTACKTYNASVTLYPASGYHCWCTGCADPASDTLHLTDSLLGINATLTWQDEPPTGFPVVFEGWEGTGTGMSVPCATDPYAFTTCPAMLTTIRYRISCYGTGSIIWSRHFDESDPATFGCPGPWVDPGDGSAWESNAGSLDFTYTLDPSSTCPTALNWIMPMNPLNPCAINQTTTPYGTRCVPYGSSFHQVKCDGTPVPSPLTIWTLTE